MIHSKFYIKNGNVEKQEGFSLDYGWFSSNLLCVYREIRLLNTVPIDLDNHISALMKYSDRIFSPFPEKLNTEKVYTYITRLLNINKIYKGGRVRIYLLYSSCCLTDFFIFIEKIPEAFYTLNEHGLTADLLELTDNHSVFYDSICVFSDSKRVLTENFCVHNGIDLCLFSDIAGNVYDSNKGWLFVVKNNSIYIPSQQTPDHKELMCERIIALLKESEFVIEQTLPTVDLLNTADEIFVVNNIEGIQWVQKFKRKHYYNKIARVLSHKLNELIKKSNP